MSTASAPAPNDERAAARGWKLREAIALHRRGALAEAEPLYRAVLSEAPAEFDALHLLGVLQYAKGRHAEAAELIERALAVNPAHAAAHSNRGLALEKLGRPADAVASYDRALAIDAGRAATHFNRGNALRALGDLHGALESYDRALALSPNDANVHCNRGAVLRKMRRYDEALESCERALALAPDDADPHYQRARTLQEQARLEPALAEFDRALALAPDATAALFAGGNVLFALGRHKEALASYDRLLGRSPNRVNALNNRGLALFALSRFEDAIESYDRALALEPARPEVLVNRGNALQSLKRHDDAAASYERALALKPEYPDALYLYASALKDARREEDSIHAYERLRSLAADYPFAKGQLLHGKMLVCDWEGLAPLAAEVAADVAAGRRSAEPFGYQGIAEAPAALRRCAEIFAADRFRAAATPLWRGERYGNPRIRVGYVSGEFRHQATSILMAEVFELADRERFEIYAFDSVGGDGSEIRQRIEAAFHEIVPIGAVPDSEAAAAIRDRRIDILVNLNGYFGQQRQGIFALRPAPVAVNYLGFPGTIGAPYIDYLIADPIVIPPGDRAHYTEAVVHLPDSYQCNDRKRRIAAATPSRAACGLPEKGFVFCCFNNNYKITPAVFDLWMRLLGRLPGSVLWLLEDNPSAGRNLRRAAATRGIAPERLVFAARAPLPEHLARHRVADLFVDTLPYNAHTTASDALWAGLPLLTVMGTTFPGRVAASLLRAVGMPELIVPTLDAYEAEALALATNPARLAGLRERLAQNRSSAPLFATDRFVRHLESAYTTMRERAERGEAPASFAVAALP